MKRTLLRDTYSKPYKRNIRMVINYLDQISGKDLKTNFIRQNIFKTSWKEIESSKISSCHLKAASKYLSYIIESKKKINSRDIQTVLADVSKYVESVDPNHETSFILVSTNILPSLIHYKQAHSIFYNHNLPRKTKSNYDYDTLSLYALRLSLESRIHGIIGIDYIRVNDVPLGLAQLIKIIKGLKNIKYSKSINWQEIEWVNNWLNHFMHRHLRPYPWSIHQAFEVLNGLLLASEYRTETRIIHSYYASTTVKDYSKFKAEFIEIIDAKYSKYTIAWRHKPELLEEKLTATDRSVYAIGTPHRENFLAKEES